MSLQELNRIALVTALIAVLARLSIPLPFSPVPITGQLMGVFLAALLPGACLFLIRSFPVRLGMLQGFSCCRIARFVQAG